MTRADNSGPMVSIIMPTFNSERTIELSLRSIRNQTYAQDRIELLVIDGGSTDGTVAIAERYGARILSNPKVQQEFAKHIGLREATGDYAVFLDSDEVLDNACALSNRVAAFDALPEVRVVLSGGYRKPEGASTVNDYINIFSDPFAWFMYGLCSEHTGKIRSWSERYETVRDDRFFIVYQFEDSRSLPLVDFCAGNSLDLAWLKRAFASRWEDETLIPQLFYLVARKTRKVAILKNDPIVHYSADSYLKFVKKLKWRAIVNVHYPRMPGTGFANREQFQPRSFRYKKYLFLPYAMTLAGPAFTAIVQFARTRKAAALAHIPLSLLTASLILYSYSMKLARLRPRLKTYGSEAKDLAFVSRPSTTGQASNLDGKPRGPLRAAVRVLKPAFEVLGLDAHPAVRASYAALARWRLRARRTAEGFDVPWEGFQISLPHQNAVSALQLEMGSYEPGTFKVLSRLLNARDAVVDVGANVGVFSLFAARQVGPYGRVIAIEPLPINLHHLQLNVARSGARSLTVVAAAMGASSGRLTIRLSGIDTGSSSAVASSGTPLEVPMQTVDDLIRAHNVSPSCVKIDTEGFEISVLRGMKRSLSAAKPPKLLLEVNRRMLALAGHTPTDLLGEVHRTHPYLYAISEMDGSLERIDVAKAPRRALYNLIASPHDLPYSEPTTW